MALHVKHLHSSGAMVNTAIVMAAATGIVQFCDSNLLSINGGPMSIIKTCAKSLLSRMHFVKRCATTKKPKITTTDFEAGKSMMQSLLLNWKKFLTV